jgi:hypothetical protein
MITGRVEEDVAGGFRITIMIMEREHEHEHEHGHGRGTRARGVGGSAIGPRQENDPARRWSDRVINGLVR